MYNVQAKKCDVTDFPTKRFYGKDFIGSFHNFPVTQQIWQQDMNVDCNFREDVLYQQFKTDVILWWHTMFAKPHWNGKDFVIGGKKLVRKHTQDLKARRNFIKRVYLMLAHMPLLCDYNNNASVLDKANELYQDPMPFPYPLASALSHGGRILIVLEGMSDREFFNVLLSGKEDTQCIAEKRRFASHAVEQCNGKIYETKVLMGLVDAISGDQYGVNIPFGGVGNKNELGYEIGITGHSYNETDAKHVKNYQLGHVFILRDRFKEKSVLLMGVESTEPGGKSPFLTGGKTHDITSGIKDQTLNRSVTGGQKWLPLMGDLAPGNYGGLIVTITPEIFAQLKVIWDHFLAIPDDELENFFLELLSRNGLEAKAYLDATMNFAAMSQAVKASPRSEDG
ncbi:MAG: hypothetical protein Q8K36_04950, partial [Alphaproteobacteria bacterium]|nr:hypothetical protein [Alphaproteobacteria bacterium]